MCEECEKYKDEAIRCRAIAKAMMEGAREDGVMMELIPSPTKPGGFALFICAPSLDEHKFLAMAGEVLSMLRDSVGDPGMKMTHPKVTGTGEDAP